MMEDKKPAGALKAELITSNRAKIKKAAEIVALYNESNPYSNETSILKKAKVAIIAHVPNYKGGVWVEQLGGALNIIYYAAFEKGHHRKGLLTACMDEIRKHHNVDGVQVSFTDDSGVWQKFGFVNQDMLNLTITYTQHSADKFKMLCEKANSNNAKAGLPDGRGMGQIEALSALLGNNKE